MSTLTPIATQTLSSAAASVTFSGIPQTYTDLILVISAIQSTGADQQCRIQFNGDTGSNYSLTFLDGNGTSAVSGRNTSQTNMSVYYVASPGTASPITSIVQLQNYSNTTTNKTMLVRAGSTASVVSAYVGLWRNTAAITSLVVTPTSGGNLQSGSTFTLYGIGAGSPKAFGGDEVTTDGTYWYHIYRSSGIFAPVQNLSCDYLVVAGGGGGGGASTGSSRSGGGGGAGGYRTGSALNFTNGTNYAVTVGAGGAGGTVALVGTVGADSILSTITSAGGGRGGSDNGAGGNGGSGGGGGGYTGDDAAGTGTSGQGSNGGTGNAAGNTFRGGGGGGAGAVGSDAGATIGSGAPNGGAGSSSSITGTSVTYAGGGGGGSDSGTTPVGAGGSGGGGAGGTAGNGNAGTANLGGGGGGAGGNASGSGTRTGGNGGSGIIVLRYAV